MEISLILYFFFSILFATGRRDMFDLWDTSTTWRIRSETDRGDEEEEEAEGGGEWKGKGMIMIRSVYLD